MADCRRLTIVVTLVTACPFLGSLGCNHNMTTNPYARPPYGNPWATPNPSMAPGAAVPPAPNVPPGMAQTGQPSAMPVIPNLPPPTGGPQTNAYGVPPTSGLVPPTPGIQRPNWNNPGTTTQQRQQANVFDPFANNEVAPEVVGGRPRDFQKPMTEATRAQGFRNTRVPF